MKKLYLLALAAIVSVNQVQAQEATQPMLQKGTRELALSGTLEFPKWEKVDYDLDVSYGYFLRDNWELGVRTLGADVSGTSRFDISLFTEYNFDLGTNIVPYIGTSFGVANVDLDNFKVATTLTPGDEGATVFGVQGGIKWFVRPYMAITTSISFNVSSDDIYAADNALDDSLTRFRFGMRYYF